jgi:DNA polymerase III alpha subunit
MNQADIDIDLPTSFKFEQIFPNWVKASIYDAAAKSFKPHPCGVYPQKIARDPSSKLCAIPYNIAEELGYIKLDFLHLAIYNYFSSREEIKALLDEEPDWNLMLAPSVVQKLFQLSNHFETVSKLKPKSTEDLADVLALIRPGKKSLIGLYLKDKESCRRLLYAKSENDEFSFKKSHAISYALVIQLQLHLINLGFEFK